MANGRKTGGKDFKPGHNQPGPGRPPHSKELRAASKLTRTTLEATLSRFLSMRMEDLEKALSDPKTPILELLIGKILQRGIEEGDSRRLNFLLDRLIGRVIDKVEYVPPEPFIIQGRNGEEITLGMKNMKQDTEV